MPADRIVASGLAIPLPAMSGALPWLGSYRPLLRASNDAEGNMPDGSWDQVLSADAIVFGAPTYMGGPSWQFKKFADASSKPWFGKAWRNKLAAGFTNSATLNGDKFSTLAYFWTLSQQHGMLWAGMGMQTRKSLLRKRESKIDEVVASYDRRNAHDHHPGHRCQTMEPLPCPA